MLKNRLTFTNRLMLILGTVLIGGCTSLSEKQYSSSISARSYRYHRMKPQDRPQDFHTKSQAYADSAPPPPPIDSITPSPGSGYIWMDGYWSWNNNTYNWIHGHWAASRPGYYWIPAHWEQKGERWRLHEGYWKKAKK